MNNNQNWKGLGEQIRNSVTDAINTGDFSRLNRLVADSVNSALQEAKTEILWFFSSTALLLLTFIPIFGQTWLQNVLMGQKRYGEVKTPGFSYPHRGKRTSKTKMQIDC